jgi:hypothetical protein
MIRGTKNKEKGANHPVIKKVVEEAIVENIKIIEGDHR